MNSKEYLRLVQLIQQREEMNGLGADEAKELLFYLKKAADDIEDWINTYSQFD